MLTTAWAIAALGPNLSEGRSNVAARPPRPLATVVRHGGLCVSGSECRSTFRITDTTISGGGSNPRPLRVGDRRALLRAIERLDPAYFRTHPFTGTCPTAYDGTETIYRFRGFALPLASCRYDLRRVEAVRVTERLLATLRPR